MAPAPEAECCQYVSLQAEAVLLDDKGNVSAQSESQQKHTESRNLSLLGIFFGVYLSFTSGCLMVLPLTCKKLLQAELSGAEYSPFYQLPLALWFIMNVLLATPSAVLMRRYGRRFGFALAACGALLASCLAFCSLVFVHSPWPCFILLNVSVVLLSSISMAEFVRFAAAEACVDESQKRKAVTKVLGFGAFGAMCGPFSFSLVTWLRLPGSDNALYNNAYFFLFTAGFAVVGLWASLSLRLPVPDQKTATTRMPLCKILRRPAVSLAIVAQVVVQFAMVTPMAAAPMAMMRSVADAKMGDVRVSSCIVLHMLSMFLPGFIMGDIIVKIGIFPVMAVGLLLQGVANVIISISSDGLTSWFGGMGLLGLGFNCAFSSGTLMLISSHSLEERARVTSLNETLRFMANACGVVLSSTLDMRTLNEICLVLLAAMFPVLMLSRSLAKGHA